MSGAGAPPVPVLVNEHCGAEHGAARRDGTRVKQFTRSNDRRDPSIGARARIGFFNCNQKEIAITLVTLDEVYSLRNREVPSGESSTIMPLAANSFRIISESLKRFSRRAVS